MDYKLLDTVVLVRSLPDHGLREGDLGTVVELYPPDGLEVEFISASGHTRALISLRISDVRAPGDSDVFSVRPLDKSA